MVLKKINLRGISAILSEKELKNVMGGSSNGCSPLVDPCEGECQIPTDNGNLAGTCQKAFGLCACVRITED